MPKSLPFCHIWYNDSKIPVVTPVESFEQVISPLKTKPAMFFVCICTWALREGVYDFENPTIIIGVKAL